MGGGRPGTNAHPTLSVTKASVVEPFYAEWSASGNSQVSDHLGALFSDTWCPKLYPVNVVQGLGANVQEFKDLYKYGLISINSHGWLWGKGAQAKATIYTEEIAFPHDYTGTGKYAIDVSPQKKWLQTWTHKHVIYYVVTPAFIMEYQKGRMNGAVVFNSSCHGKSDSTNAVGGSMSWAFIKNGAAVYLGYTGAVGNQWGSKWPKSFFDHLLVGNNVEESIDFAKREHGLEEPGNAGTRIRWDVSRKEDYRKLQVAAECDGYMTIKHEMLTASGFVFVEKSELRSTGTLTLAPWMEGFYTLTKEEAECTYSREEYSVGQKASDEHGSGQFTELYGDPEGGINEGSYRLRLCIDSVNQKVFLFASEQFTEMDWVTYDLTTYPVGGLPGGTSSSESGCNVPSVFIASAGTQLTGVCAAFYPGPAIGVLAFDVPADGEIGEDYVQGSKVFGSALGTATVEFAYRLRNQ